MDEASSQLIGSWRLLNMRRFRDGAFYRHPMGEGVSGRLIYSADGFVAAFLMSAAWRAGRAPQTWENFLSYSGRWRLEGMQVTHTLDAASISEMIGQDLVRHATWSGQGELLLATAPHLTREGHKSCDRLVWARDG